MHYFNGVCNFEIYINDFKVVKSFNNESFKTSERINPFLLSKKWWPAAARERCCAALRVNKTKVHPVNMFAVIIYAYSQGKYSTRDIEFLCKDSQHHRLFDFGAAACQNLKYLHNGQWIIPGCAQ